MKAAWAALFLCCLGMIATMFLRSCPAILALDLQHTFGVSPTDIALFSSATLLGYGLMQTPSGLITDAIGGRKTLALFLLMASLSTLAFAFAIKFELAVLARLTKGLSITIVPPAMTVISRYFPLEKQTQAMGIFMGSSALGSLLAAEPLARLSIAVGWRYSMALAGLLIMLLSLAIFLVLRDAGSATATAPTQSASGKLKGIGLNMLKVLRTRQFWYFGIWQICTAATFFAFMTMWAGPYLIEGYGLTKIEASRILLVQGACALVLVPLVGVIADRTGSRKGMMIFSSAAGLAGSCGLAFFTGELPAPLIVASLASISSFATGGATCAMSLISRNFPKSMTGTGIGCVNMFWPIAASALGVIMGLTLQFNTERLGAAAGAPSPALSAAYGSIMLIPVVTWSIALVLSVFFIKEHFTVSGE